MRLQRIVPLTTTTSSTVTPSQLFLFSQSTPSRKKGDPPPPCLLARCSTLLLLCPFLWAGVCVSARRDGPLPGRDSGEAWSEMKAVCLPRGVCVCVCMCARSPSWCLTVRDHPGVSLRVACVLLCVHGRGESLACQQYRTSREKEGRPSSASASLFPVVFGGRLEILGLFCDRGPFSFCFFLFCISACSASLASCCLDKD